MTQPNGWNSPRPTAAMRQDYFTPWAHDRGRQTCFSEVPDADERWHPLYDRDIRREYEELTGKDFDYILLDIEERTEAARIRRLASL